MAENWRVHSRKSHVIVNGNLGVPVAVVIDEANAPIVAAAHEMFKLCKEAKLALPFIRGSQEAGRELQTNITNLVESLERQLSHFG